ncbi:energy transducer TonB [Stutzerimonas sp. VN223-3]|uniref:energy transducer TonB n=1 Tax=Stutzerimonas sp. VN223-3 TaxID=3384601 RepID=UPI0038B60BD4
MSSLSMPLPDSFPVARPQWPSHASAAVVTLALHAGVFGLLLHGWTPELTAPSATQVLKTQLVSLPAPQPVVAPPVEPEPTPLPEPVVAREAVEEPQVDPRIEQHRLEQAELAFKRAEQERLAEEERQRERQQKQQLERERQERLEAERQQREAQRREQLAREEQQRQQTAQAEAAAAERARQAEAAAASRQYLPIAKDAPDYPQRALDKGIEGSCTVSYSVNSQGRIENPKALDDCHPLFIRPSLTAAKSFRYQPRIVDGRAVAVPEVKNTFHYRIQ